MVIANNIQSFLNRKFDKTKLRKKDFIHGAGISSSAVSKLVHATQLNPSLTTILKIADYFQCSIDEVVGRKKYIKCYNSKKIFLTPSLNEINNNLRLFIKAQLNCLNINVYSLEKNCGLGDSTVMHFIKENSTKKILSTPVIIKLAEYFSVSIDHMIGRTLLTE